MRKILLTFKGFESKEKKFDLKLGCVGWPKGYDNTDGDGKK